MPRVPTPENVHEVFSIGGFMARKIVLASIALLLFGAGWIVGLAQTGQPDFELVVKAPAGETTIECRGCKALMFSRTEKISDSEPQPFQFKCSGPQVTRCSSGIVQGYLDR
jgi:hypothetical protein